MMPSRYLIVGAITAVAAFIGPVAVAEDADWVLPRTPWGDPDFQGVWTNETITPFERPVGQQGKAVLSEDEAAVIEAGVARRRVAADGTSSPGSVGSYNQVWMDAGTRFLSTRQSSLVVDPPDGRVPTRPSAEARRDDYFARQGDSYEYMSVWDRCISRGIPGSIFPAGYNNAYRILQTPDHVAILYEMIHDARIIPLRGGGHVDEGVRLWMGDSRGRWEGDTLVVEVRNFTDKGWIASNSAARRIKGIPQTEDLLVVERFRRVSADVIEYEVTIEDPPIYTRPWKIAMPLTLDPEYDLYEYACHEGNRAVELGLSGARAVERAAPKATADAP